MSYLSYVMAAYAVFFIVLTADWLAGHLAVRRALRNNRRPSAARRTGASTLPAAELER